MGASNFARPTNASKYFVVLADRKEKIVECNDCNHTHFEYDYKLENIEHCTNCNSDELGDIETKSVSVEQFEVEDFIENMKSEIVGHKDGQEDDTQFHDRNYCRTTLGALNVSKWYGDVEVSVTIRAILQGAYYEGATLDYQVLVFDGYQDIEEVEERNGYNGYKWKELLYDLFRDESEMNEGLQKIQQRNALKWLEITITNLSQQLETLYETYSSHKLQCDGVFSNGEAIYSEIK